ncbi:MAG: V-type ATP synthase subunit F [Pygmaiobacter sp.]
MYQAAVMGDRDSIYGFAALGLAIYPVRGQDEAVHTLQTLAKSETAVIFITEALAGELAGEIAVYADKLTPAIIPIPGAFGNTGLGVANLRRFVEKAVGSDIIFGSEG